NLDRLHAQPLKQLEFDPFGVYGTMGLLYLAMKRPDSALWYAQKGYNICLHAANKKRLPLAAATLGNVYEAMGDYKSARSYYQVGIETSIEYNGLYFLARLYNNLSGLFKKEKNLDSCIYCAHQALQLAQTNKFGDYASTACSMLA